MYPLKDATDLALISHSQGLIVDKELLLFLEENKFRNPEFSHDVYDRFDLENMEEAECKSEFRVEKHDITFLAEALGLPETFTCPQRSVAIGIEGLCMVLKQTSFPCSYSDMIYRFGRPVPASSCSQSTLKPKLKVLKSFSSLIWIFPKLTIKKIADNSHFTFVRFHVLP